MRPHATLLITLLLAACAAEPMDADVDDAALAADAPTDMAAPPPVPAWANAFAVGEIQPGADVRFTWADLPPGARVQVFATPNGVGAGPCPARLQGDCLDILGPVSVVATAPANRPGVATGRFVFPANQALGTYTFQAVAYSPATGWLFSEPYERSTGFGFCPFTYLPVCGVNRVMYDNDCLAEINGTVVRSQWACP
jgi:hypothetical protein